MSRVRTVVAMATVLLVAALAVAGTVAVWAWLTLREPVTPPGGEARLVVPEGQSAGRILERLEARGVIADAELGRAWLVYQRGDPPLQYGEYRFEGPATLPEVLEKLIRGEVVTHPVTVIEGLTLEETAQALAEAGFGELETFRRLMEDPAPIADLDPEATTLEGYLFPDTYRFARGTGEAEIVAAMVRAFRETWSERVAPRLAARRQDTSGGSAEWTAASPREVAILASIVEKEARLDEERPVIAGVYANRLERGIGLYADPTVIYAIKRLGRWDGNLRRPDLELDSPWNTYVHSGLPPGPICSPGAASLAAAAAPADVPYLYFVSRNDGSHVFAETLAEHNRNVAKWQKEYWRKKWAEEGRK